MTTIHPSSIYEPPSLQSTPGLEIPGAFPHEQHTRQHPLSDSHRATDSQQPISLPSTEKEGTHPGEHCGGVGPLPGSISETSVAKLPDERASEAKTAPGPSSRTQEVFAEGDDPREAVVSAVAPASTSAAKVPEGEAAPESAFGSKELAADTGREDVAVAKLPDERASEAKTAPGPSDFAEGDDPREAVVSAAAPASTSAAKVPEGEAAPESAFGSKELPAEDIAEPAAGSFVTAQESPQNIEPQGTSPDAVSKQVPAEPQRAETSGPTSADSKFKEELRKEEKNHGVFANEGGRARPPPSQVTPAQAMPAQGLSMLKGTEEGPNKTVPVQQQQQQLQQPDIVGGQATRKGRSSSDSDASNHVKASIMNRVKGEMKVLLGKASGNKEKIEEGERMKQGTQ